MREFFKGWKRKLGVVTLIVACVFMADWLKCRGRWSESHNASGPLYGGTNSSDVYSLTCGKTRWIALNESLIWTSRPVDDSNTHFLYWDIESSYGPGCFFAFRELKWHYFWCGFGIGYFNELSHVKPDGYVLLPNPLWMVPYWSVVFLLSVLTAYLLLSKPQGKIKRTTESVG